MRQSSEEPLVSTRIAIVSAHYYEPYLARATGDMAKLAGRLGANWWAVANKQALVPALRDAAGRCANLSGVLLHDNSGAEFGAYQSGLDHCRGSGSEFDWMLFCNDTYSIHQAFTALQIQYMEYWLRRAVPAPCVIGEVQGLPSSFSILGHSSDRWVTTNVFALNRPALDALGWRIYAPEIYDLISADADPERFFSADVDPLLRSHLARWLFDRTAPAHWYGAAPLTAANTARSASKARAILQEKHLSARLNSAAALFIPVYRFSASLVLRAGLETVAQALFKRWVMRRVRP